MKKKSTKKETVVLTKEIIEVKGRVKFDPKPELMIAEFKNGDFGYNLNIEVDGQGEHDVNIVCLCYDSRELADGIRLCPETGKFITDNSRRLNRGDFIHVKASDYSEPKKKVFDKKGNQLFYHNYWVASPAQVKVISSEAQRPRPKVTEPTGSSRPRPKG